MLVIPNIASYKPILFQFAGELLAHDTREWGLIAKTNPYPLLPEVKDPYKNEWADEDGDDEYCVAKSTRYQAFTFEVSFYIKAKGSYPAGELRTTLYALLDRMAASGTFRYFDSYTNIGWLQVRYAGYEEEEFVAKHDWARAIFKMKFKVLNPAKMADYNSDGNYITVWLRPHPPGEGDDDIIDGPPIIGDDETYEPPVNKTNEE